MKYFNVNTHCGTYYKDKRKIEKNQRKDNQKVIFEKLEKN